MLCSLHASLKIKRALEALKARLIPAYGEAIGYGLANNRRAESPIHSMGL
jgi:hypothetical protein